MDQNLEKVGRSLLLHNPEHLVPELCRKMYSLGWVSGTGGGVTVRSGSNLYITPSGVQKEMIEPADIFIINLDGKVMSAPSPERDLKQSQCTPLFISICRIRDAGAVIHSHSMNAVLASAISNDSEFRVSHQEMIKGIKKGSTGENHRYDDTLVVPIIENTPFECDLAVDLERVIRAYPNTNAVLVRRHGVYIWGSCWESAKTMSECYDYLFKYAVECKRLGIAYN